MENGWRTRKIIDCTAQKWFRRFSIKNKSLKEAPRERELENIDELQERFLWNPIRFKCLMCFVSRINTSVRTKKIYIREMVCWRIQKIK